MTRALLTQTHTRTYTEKIRRGPPVGTSEATTESPDKKKSNRADGNILPQIQKHCEICIFRSHRRVEANMPEPFCSEDAFSASKFLVPANAMAIASMDFANLSHTLQ